MMNLRQLKIFIEVAKSQSITKAANNLFLAQPAVSQCIMQLEDEFNIMLFQRANQRIYLTEEGKNLLQYAKNIIKEVELFENEANRLSVLPSLNIGCSLSMGEKLFPTIIKNNPFQKDFKFHFDIIVSSEVVKMIEYQKIDIGIVEGLDYLDKNMIYMPLFMDKLVLACSKDYCDKKEILIQDVGNYNFLLRDCNSGTRKAFDRILALNRVNIEPFCESYSNQALLQFAINGMGICVVAYSVIKDYLKNDILQEVTIKGIEFEREIALIYHKNKKITPKIKGLIDYLIESTKNIIDKQY